MTKSIIFQGITSDNHLSAVKHVMTLDNLKRLIVSVAFMNEGGLWLLQEELAPVAHLTTLVTGIRNGITSAQSLSKSLEIGCTPYVVDTGSRTIIFHPKVYLSRNDSEARLVIGSANLTVGGLHSNIEASLLMTMNLEDPEDAALVSDLERKIDAMIAKYSAHIFLVPSVERVEELLASGRVIDERTDLGPITSGSSGRRDLDTVPRMNLETKPISRLKIVRPSRPSPSAEPLASPAPTGPVVPVREILALVWTSNPLTRRDLTIPIAPNTNPTGSMLFKKGALEIDQRHYFREDVFQHLEWHFDSVSGRQHMERVQARFQIVIRNVNYGVFTLRLSHNSRTDTVAYLQRNSMTQIHWGEARHLIAREDLLGRTMNLYRDQGNQGSFVLEID